jgi:hypothetical protein
VTAVGYTNAAGIVDEIRIGRAGQTVADTVWRRDSVGKWRSDRPSSPLPLADDRRIGANGRRLDAIIGSWEQILAGK